MRKYLNNLVFIINYLYLTMDCKSNIDVIYLFLFENFYFRWHQIMLRFGFESVVFRFDNQFNDEIELPLNLIRTSGKFYIANTVILGASNRPENRNDRFFKVKIKE